MSVRFLVNLIWSVEFPFTASFEMFPGYYLPELFENPDTGSKTRLMNILMQLRKCVNHPYLFDGTVGLASCMMPIIQWNTDL